MGWLSDTYNYVADKVKKAIDAIKKVYNQVKNKVKKVVKNISNGVKSAYNYVKDKVTETYNSGKRKVKRVREVVEKWVKEKYASAKGYAQGVKDYISNAVSGYLIGGDERVKSAYAGMTKEDLAKEKEKILAEREEKFKVEKEEKKEKISFWDFFNILGYSPGDLLTKQVYRLVTGKTLTEREFLSLKLKTADFIIPLNALSKLFLGRNLDGKKEEFGGTADELDLALGLTFFIPTSFVSRVGSKVGAKIGSKGLLRIADKLYVKKATVETLEALLKSDNYKYVLEAMRIDPVYFTKFIAKLSPGMQAKVMKGLAKQHPKTAYKLMETALLKSAERGRGILGLVKSVTRARNIKWGLTMILGTLGMAYGIPFGTSWFAKEGLVEQLQIPLSDRMRDYRYEPTKEKAKIIQDSIDQLEKAIPIATAQIKSVSWLWPLTKNSWNTYLDGIKFELEQIKKEFKLLSGIVEIPEVVITKVRGIIDGDTIDVDLNSKDYMTGKLITLPQYERTGHARIRMLGINAPEKSPKGEILCSDVDIINVEKKWADESRNNLRRLDDKEVTIYIDLKTPMDTHNRILGLIQRDGINMSLEQIKKGLACGYYREDNKYLDRNKYTNETLDAKEQGIGMWGDVPVPKGEIIKLKVSSSPSNSSISIDGEETKKLTAETFELTEGTYRIAVWNRGYELQNKTVTLEKGKDTEIYFKLSKTGIEKEEEEKPVIKPVNGNDIVPEPVPEPTPTPIIPKTIQEFYDLIKPFYIGRLYMSKKELLEFGTKYNLDIGDIDPVTLPEKAETIQEFYDEMKTFYIGLKYMSKSELITLGYKYNLNVTGI